MEILVSKIVSYLIALGLFVSSIFGLGFVKPEENTYGRAKNVIFMIGDGMGFNSINKVKNERSGALAFDRMPYAGKSMTASKSSMVTDSAAGATALACGVRTKNRFVGTYMSDAKASKKYPMNLAELAVKNGKKTGVVTTDKTTGATPAAFSVHSSDRDNEEDITRKQEQSAIDIIWGAKTESFSKSKAADNGYTYINDYSSMNSLKEGSKSFGQFDGELWHRNKKSNLPTLANMTSKAIDLLDDDPDGFFLMVEGAHIDKNNHNNDGEGMIDALQSFSDAINVAASYASTHEGTLVVVTADHETGGITLINGEYTYTTGSHTGVSVPIYAFGTPGVVNNDEHIKNTVLSQKIAFAMGQREWPIKIINN